MTDFNKTPKLNKKLLRDFANKNLDITKSALHLIIFLTPYIDRDGRIHFDEEFTKRELKFEQRTLNNALNDLLNTTYKGKQLLNYENGYYVSGFHVSTNGKTTYQNNLPILSEGNFRNLSLNQTRLFLYILTSNVYNQYNKVKIENLYDNKLHDDEYGIRVHEGYQVLAEDLFVLNDRGFINFRIPGEKYGFLKLEKSDPEHKKLFHEHCDFDYVNNKKNRTSMKKKRNHVIGLKVNPELFNQKSISNNAGRAELRHLADHYHMFHEDFKPETINYFINKKMT